MSDVLLLGVRQRLRGDDSVGLAAVERWQQQYHHKEPALIVKLAESPGLALLDILDGFQAALIVDAIASGAEPGQIHQLKEAELAAFSPGAKSAHGLGIAETLSIAQALPTEKLPDNIEFIGVEVESVEIGQPLSASIERSLPAVVGIINRTTRRLVEEIDKGAALTHSTKSFP